jgi:hypothetical protein
MNPPRRSRLRFSLTVAACLTACVAACIAALLLDRGEWRQLGGVLGGLPFAAKSPGYRWAYLSRWAIPLFLSYLAVLCGGVFWGLRRLRKGAH